jgi:hypothetical protein
MSSRQAPPDLARELLEEIDSPCLGTSEISTGGVSASWGGWLLLPSMTPTTPFGGIAPFAFGPRSKGNSKIQMTIGAISNRMTKNTAVICYWAASNSRRRSCQSRSIVRGTIFISVTFAMAAAEFAEASQVVKIISGEIEPP